MYRDWRDFKALKKGIAGARTAFEDACETLFRKVYSNFPVGQVEVRQGDGGIDVFVGKLGIEPITVIQCKFFLEDFDDAQKNQIRKSFNTAVTSDKYELKDWILCLPRIIDIDENSWWFGWKERKTVEFDKTDKFISLKMGNELIDLFKQYDLYNKVFEIDDSIKIAEIHEAVVRQPISLPEEVSPKDVFFTGYSDSAEPYYIKRKIDKEFVASLKLNNLWVFGDSGFGKTTLVNRNLTVSDLEYCYCDLSPIKILSPEDVLEEILSKVEEKFGVERGCYESNKIKEITKLLCKIGKEIIIVIDELSVKSDLVLKEIADDLLNLVIHFRNSSREQKLRFVVSTISNPKEIIGNKSKAVDHFQYLDCSDWSNDIEQLFITLSESLKLNLIDTKTRILQSSQNSPRVLKSIFRKIIVLDALNISSIEQAIRQVEYEGA